jgi:protocatechuate 3,4-dioxygenase beta subunit
MRYFISAIYILFISVSYIALAQENYDSSVDANDTIQALSDTKLSNEELLMDCKVTPALEHDHIPFERINKSNNLLRKPGSVRRATGSYIQLRGKVLDEDCLPISNATIQIWQTDNSGLYLEAYSLKTEWDIRDKKFDRNFAYSGTAYTNNLGEFNFVTILPVSNVDLIAPHINMIVKHEDFGTLNSMIFFNHHPKNHSDLNLKKLGSEEQKLLLAKGKKLYPYTAAEGREYNFNITLKGINKYRSY